MSSAFFSFCLLENFDKREFVIPLPRDNLTLNVFNIPAELPVPPNPAAVDSFPWTANALPIALDDWKKYLHRAMWRELREA